MARNPFFDVSQNIDFVTEENKSWFINMTWFHPGRIDNCVNLAWYKEKDLLRNIRNVAGIVKHFDIPYGVYYPRKGRFSAVIIRGELGLLDDSSVDLKMLEIDNPFDFASYIQSKSTNQVNFVLGHNIDVMTLAAKCHPSDKKWFFCVNMKELT